MEATGHMRCLGSDEMNNATAEAFGCEHLTRGRVLLDCGATETVGSVEATEAILDKAQEATGADPDQVSVDILTIDPCASSVMPSVNKRCPRSEWKSTLKDTWHISMCTPRKPKGVLVPMSAKSYAMYRHLELETVRQLERSPTGHLWMNLFEQMPVVSDNPLVVARCIEAWRKCWLMPQNSKVQVLVARTDSQRTFTSRRTHATDTLDDDNTVTIESSS